MHWALVMVYVPIEMKLALAMPYVRIKMDPASTMVYTFFKKLNLAWNMANIQEGSTLFEWAYSQFGYPKGQSNKK
jgi:hypothetical protein